MIDAVNEDVQLPAKAPVALRRPVQQADSCYGEASSPTPVLLGLYRLSEPTQGRRTGSPVADDGLLVQLSLVDLV